MTGGTDEGESACESTTFTSSSSRTNTFVDPADNNTKSRYAQLNPGPDLAECRWLADHRVAIAGAETWAFEVLGNPAVKHALPCHQLLLAKEGIRIGQAFNCEALANDGVSEFVFLQPRIRTRRCRRRRCPLRHR